MAHGTNSFFSVFQPLNPKFLSRRDMTFFFQVSRNFWDQIRRARAYRFRATPIWKKFVNPKIAQKRDFVYKVNANCVFTKISYKLEYFEFYWLKLIYFCSIMPQIMSATNISQKNNKNKRSKNKEIHKKFVKQ